MEAPQAAFLEIVVFAPEGLRLLSAPQWLQGMGPTQHCPQAVSCSLAHPWVTWQPVRIGAELTLSSEFFLPKDSQENAQLELNENSKI